MTQPPKHYWFPAASYGWGWGWGLPVTWQGWVVFLGHIALLLVGAVYLMNRFVFPWFLVYAIVVVGSLLTVCWIKGERTSDT